MKRKTLIKKITALEARLQKGAKKLAKLKRKLQDAAKARAERNKTKSITSDGAGAPRRNRAKKAFSPAKTESAAKESRPGTKKRKLNLSPERRAQLAEAMKARWAAKRAAGGSAQGPSTNQDFTLGQNPQSS